MKKKITGLCILLLVLLLGFYTISYAADNTLYQLDIDNNVDKEDLFNAIFEHYNFSYHGMNSTTETNLNSWKSQAFSSDFNCFSYSYNPNSSYNWQYTFDVGYCSGVSNNKISSNSSSILLSNIKFISAKKFTIPKNAINSSLYQNVGTYTLSTLTTWSYVLVQNSAGQWYEYSSDGWSVSSSLTPQLDFLASAIGTIYLPNDGGNTNIAYCINPILGPGSGGFRELGKVINYTDFNKLGCSCLWYYSVSGDTMLGRQIPSSYYSLKDGVLSFDSNNLYDKTVYQFFFYDRDDVNNIIPLDSVYFYVGLPSSNPSFRSGDFSWSDPQIMVEAIVGYAGSGDNPGNGILGGISSFFNGLYQRFFVLDDDSIQDIYQNSVDLLPSGESPLDFYNTIVNAAQSSNSDFVISWDDIDFDMLIAGQHITTRFISGDSINFNALIRSDERISNMWSVFQTIITFTVYYLLFVGWYDCILKLLGVSEGLITEDSDDITTVGSVESVSSSIDMNTGEVKESNKIRKTTYRRTVSRK